MKKQNVTLITLLGIALLAWLWLGGGHQAKPSDYVVKIGYLPTLGSAAFDVAKAEHYFEEAGVKYEVTPIQTSNQVFEALVRGDIDITPLVSVVPVLASEQVSDRKVEIFATGDYTADHPFDKLLVKKDSVVQNLKDLEGKKIGVFPGSTATNLLKKYLSEQGVATEKMMFVPLVPSAQLAALYSGSVDVLHTYEPTTSIAEESGNTRVLFGSVFAAQYDHAPLGVGALSKAFIAKEPVVAQKAVAVFDRANARIVQHPESVRAMIGQAFKLDENVTNRLVLVRVNQSKDINVLTFSGYLDMLVSAHELTSKPDLAGLFYKAK